ncbi:MAG: glycosyltransferase, partial [Patescibacteria group bacterium]
MITIGIDASRANHEQKTGVEWYAWHLIEEFKVHSSKFMAESSVHFILYSDEPLCGALAKLPSGWSSRVLSWPPKRLWTQVRLSFEMLIHPPDVLFIPAHVVPLIHPKKTVMTVHDIAAARFPETYNWFERWYTLWSAKYALNKLWRVIVPSDFTKNELLQATSYKLQAKVCVIPHGYDVRYGKRGTEEQMQNIFKKYGIESPYIISVGRLETKKNTWRIVEAFNKLSLQLKAYRLQLILVGQPGHGYERVRDAIDKSPYRDQIKELGWVGK